MRAVNSLLVIALLLFVTVMSWTYFSVRGNQTVSYPQVGIGGGPNDTISSVNYKEQFRTLLAEHGTLTTVHLTNVYDGNDTAATSGLLEDNAQKLGDIFKKLGTTADKEAFLKTFRGHIDEYEIYTKGRKENKLEAMSTAKENLQMHALDFGKLVHKLMPSISEQRGTQLMNDHAALTLGIVDAHASGNAANKLEAVKNAKIQATEFADELAWGANVANN